METKICVICKVEKDKSCFWKRPDRPIGIIGRCIDCCNEKIKQDRLTKPALFRKYNRSSNLKRYGINETDYNRMFKKQRGKCLGCGKHQDQLQRKLDIDHCHTTKVVRGLLCLNCNRTLGFAKDNINTLKALIRYLRKHSHSSWGHQEMS